MGLIERTKTLTQTVSSLLWEPPWTIDSPLLRGLFGGIAAVIGFVVSNAITPSFPIRLVVFFCTTVLLILCFSYVSSKLIQK